LFNTFKVVREREHTQLTAIENIQLDQIPQSAGVTKVLYEGQILVVRDGIAYDLLGRIVK
jgi:hypothetical protein